MRWPIRFFKSRSLYDAIADPRFPRSVPNLLLSGDSSFAFCDLPFALAAFILFTDSGAFIVVAFGAIVTFFAFIETGAYALLRKLRSMSHNGFARTSLCHTCVASFHIARRTRTHNVSRTHNLSIPPHTTRNSPIARRRRSGAVDLRPIDSISQLAELKAYNVCGATSSPQSRLADRRKTQRTAAATTRRRCGHCSE